MKYPYAIFGIDVPSEDDYPIQHSFQYFFVKSG